MAASLHGGLGNAKKKAHHEQRAATHGTKTLRRQALAEVAKALDNAAGVDAKLRGQYEKAADKVLTAMPAKALALWHKHLGGIKFYPTAAEVDAFARAEGSEDDPQSFYPAVTTATGTLHLNGGSENDRRAKRATQSYYAHEFAHVIDSGKQYTRHTGMGGGMGERPPSLERYHAPPETEGRGRGLR